MRLAARPDRCPMMSGSLPVSISRFSRRMNYEVDYQTTMGITSFAGDRILYEI